MAEEITDMGAVMVVNPGGFSMAISAKLCNIAMLSIRHLRVICRGSTQAIE